MTGRTDLLTPLLESGGREGRTFPSPEAASAHLLSLMSESKKQVEKFGHLMKAARSGHAHGAATGAGGVLSHAQLKECEKQQTLWQKRLSTLRRLRQGFEAAGCPHAPASVEVNVVGPCRVSIHVRVPEFAGKTLFTKCKVQWSRTDDTFKSIEGEQILTDVGVTSECEVENLVEGKRYFFRASFGNPKGFGPFSASTPKSVVPSSWRSVEDRLPRITDQREVCEEAFKQVLAEEDDSYEPHKFGKKRGGLRHLFSSSTAPKFQKSILANRLYLCCVLFNEDKVLMTNEEVLPIMEIDDDFPPHLQAEFQWFVRLCLIWREVERIKHEAKIGSS